MEERYRQMIIDYSLTNRMVLLLFFVPVITFFTRLTNSWHHLFYTNWEARQLFGYYSLYMERGYWYYVNISYTILCLLLTIIIYFLGYLKNQASYAKSHFLVFLFASFALKHPIWRGKACPSFRFLFVIRAC